MTNNRHQLFASRDLNTHYSITVSQILKSIERAKAHNLKNCLFELTTFEDKVSVVREMDKFGCYTLHLKGNILRISWK